MPSPAAAAIIQFSPTAYRNSGTLLVPVEIDGYATDAVIDTGSNVALTLPGYMAKCKG